MTRFISAIVLPLSCASLLLAAPSGPQQAAPVQQPKAADLPAARPPAQLHNVRIEVTITDDRETGTPKVVALVVADRENGRVRSGISDLMLNVDARPEIVRDGRVRVHLSLEYRPARAESDRAAISALTESLGVILEDGKPLVVSQAADPASTRIVKVEVKATVLGGR